jgi:acyl carrier protein
VAAAPSEVIAVVRGLLHNNDLDISPATRFDDLANCDSMDLVALVVEVEGQYDLQFDLSEVDRLVTVGDLVQMIEAKRALASA